MDISVDIETDHEFEEEWKNFIALSKGAQVNHTIKWRNFMARVLDARPIYFAARDIKARIHGVLPGFIKSNPSGSMLNSLPFFGTSGGIVCPDKNPAVYQALFSAWHDLAKQEKCVSSTIITSPFFDDQEMYEQYCPHDVTDSRIGQITALMGGDGDVETMFFDQFTKNCRRDIRKAIRSGIHAEQNYTPDAWAFLEQTHFLNMKTVGGKTKPGSFFQIVPEFFAPGQEYRLYVGLVEDKPVAALLLFYYNGIVEYFLPAVLPEYRSLQPQNIVIHTAMIDAAKEGYRYWNWGGTWETQHGVYQFKKQFGAKDFPYQYFVKIHDKSLLKLSRQQLSEAFPYFYSVPFRMVQP